MKPQTLAARKPIDAFNYLRRYGDLRRSLIRSLKEENKELSRIIHFFKKERSRLFKEGCTGEAGGKQILLNAYTQTYISNHLLYNALRGCDMTKVHKGPLSLNQRCNLRGLWGRLHIDSVIRNTVKIDSALNTLFKQMNTENIQNQYRPKVIKPSIISQVKSFFGAN